MNAHFLKASENANRDYRNLKEFSENASHELQTPLAIIRANFDMLTQEGITERQSELMQGVYVAIRRMSWLQESLLLLTKIDNRQFTGSTVIRIDGLMREKITQLQELLHARNLDCRLELSEVTLSANNQLLDILLNNLFSNAIRHNVSSGRIYPRLKGNSLEVSNTGAPEALDHQLIFRRFYKKESQAGSNGLGLSIIKSICDTSMMQVQYSFAESLHSFTISWQPS